MKSNSLPKKLSLKHTLIFSIIFFLLFLILLEGGIRLYYIVSGKITPKTRHYSKKYGWVTVPNIKKIRRYSRYGTIRYSTNKNGFRLFGEVKTNKIKIFVIGDSYTQARKVSDGETYYHYIKKHSDAEIFAYGGGGYGSLQEYMILDKYFDLIKPDLIIWQFCGNDIINNSWELEARSLKHNNHMTRPYYIDGKIERKYPHNSWIYRNILRHSYLIKLLKIKLNILLAGMSAKKESDLLSIHNPLFNKAVDTTSKIMNLVRKKVGNTTIVAFSTNGGHTNKVFSDICKKFGIYYIYGIPNTILKAEKSGLRVNGMPCDPHWNNVAHSIAGKILVEYLLKMDFLEKNTSPVSGITSGGQLFIKSFVGVQV